MSAPSVMVAALVRDEAGKYWESALKAWSQFADRILVLDDNSTDKTAKLARKFTNLVYSRYDEPAWGAETSARRELWQLAFDNTEPGDVILWLDADMVPMRDPREFIDPRLDTYYFALYDLWGAREDGALLYRDDAVWTAHTRPRAWAIRRPKRAFKEQWSGRGLHSGHLPLNWTPQAPFFAPPSHSLLHYGYFHEADRHAKAAAYLAKSDQLASYEVAHARTIVDERPQLKVLQYVPQFTLRRAS